MNRRVANGYFFIYSNYISEIDSQMDWGFMADSLSSLSLSNNQLCVVGAGALSALRRLARLDLGGNRLRALAPGALPLALAALRLADNLLARAPCAALQLPRLRHLHLRNNLLRPAHNHTCHASHTKIDSVDLSRNELEDSFEFDFPNRIQLKQLILDLNDFTAVPSFVLDSSRLEKLSISYNKLKYISDATIHALKHTLEHLDLDHNDLIVLPEAMREMSCLRQLSVAYNRLEELCCLPSNLHSLSLAGNFLSSLPTGLRDLTPGTLTYLDVGYNRIQAISSEQFGAWAEALATLSLKGNRLAALGAAAFPTLLPLRELLLSFNDLYYVDSNAFLNLTALQVLELSSTLFSGEFPIATSIDRLSWLSLDNNNIHFISSRDICNFPSLEYLNLEFNKVIEFPNEISEENSSCPCKLKELRLSYNYVSKINAQFLASFVELQSVDLSNNRMHNVSERSFTNLPNLVYLSLSENVVEYIARRAFHDLPKLEVLDLHQNKLVEFSTEHFENVSNDETNFSVNVSYNKISALNGGRKAFISVLDLSNNMLESLSKDFFDSLGSNIRQLIISNNKLIHIDNFSFGSMPTLDILSLHNNKLSALKKRAFADMPWLQMIDLSRNEVSQLSSEPFQNMARLRHLRLAANELRSLPRDSFKNTVLEYLDLSNNQLTIFPSSALARVGFTLRRLELASNRLEYLDVAMFHGISFLHELNLAGNALTVLSDNTFAGLARLTRLELSHNTIKTNFKELFHNLPRLRRLGLAGSNLRSVPNLPLANLTDLDLSNNHIFSFRESDVRHLTNLRILDVSRNRLTSLQPAMWVAFPQLATLNVSCNPIVRIARGSFEGLSRLHHLQMDNLWHLENIEPRSFRSLTSLRSLALESRPSAGRGEVSLGDVVSATPALESLTLHVRETVLETQLRGLRAPKLVALDVRGSALAHVAANALTALGAQRALALRLAGTRVAALPAGLARPLAHIPHLALDFSDNRLTAIGPAALYPNLTDWSRLATKLVPGDTILFLP